MARKPTTIENDAEATVEDRIRARAQDPNALRVGISATGDSLRIIFQATPDYPRRAFTIRGNEIAEDG